MGLPGDVPVVLTLLEDDGTAFRQEWVRSEIAHLGKALDFHVDLVAGRRYDEPARLAVTVFMPDGTERRKLIDLEDALRELAREIVQ